MLKLTNNMKILMFGWEFPPHITGGLGTACFGLTKGLAKQDVDVIFVVPKAYGDESEEAVRLVNASDVPFDFKDENYNEYWERIKYFEIGSNIVPYVGPDEFSRMVEKQEKTGKEYTSNVFKRDYKFTGKYGTNLMEEISRYALVASALSLKEDFDIIHAHDWLTYPAGVAAKEVIGQATCSSYACD